MDIKQNPVNIFQPADQHWKKIHEQAKVVDLHAHPSMKAQLFRRSLTRRMWVPEFLMGELNPLSVRTSFLNLQAGGVDVLLSSVYPPEKEIFENIKLLKFIPLKTLRHLPIILAHRIWEEFVEPPYFEVTQQMLDGMERDVLKYQQKRNDQQREVVIAKNAVELNDYVNNPNPPITLIHNVEGGHSLFGEMSMANGTHKPWEELEPDTQQQIEHEVLGNLKALSDRGVAYLTLAHFYPNNLITPTFPYPEHIALHFLTRETIEKIRRNARLTTGLTPLGRKVVEKMIEYGMLIDISHATPKARQEIYSIVERSQRQEPIVIATHVGAYHVNPTPYNLEDWEIRWISDHGGVIGIIFMNYWLMPHETKYGMNFISRNIEHVFRIGGENVVAIGTDFDGADPPDDIDNASELPFLTGRLMGEYQGAQQPKYTDEQIMKFLGGNALATLLNGWGT